MGKKLYVGNLSYETTEDELKTLFAEFGEVESVKIITDNYSGRSKGFGFVEMKTNEEAGKAIESLKEREFGGRKIVVNEARPMEKRSGGRGRGGFGGNRLARS